MNDVKFLYLLSRPEGEYADWDEYEGAVVCAHSAEEALKMHPSGRQEDRESAYQTWTTNPQAQGIGLAYNDIPVGIVLADFLRG